MADPVKNDRNGGAIDYIPNDFESAVFMGNPHIDSLFTAVQILSTELWVSRRRSNIVEALLEKKLPVTHASIEQYVPTPEEDARWKADRDRMVTSIYAPFLRPADIDYASPEATKFDSYKATNVPKAPPVGQKKL